MIMPRKDSYADRIPLCTSLQYYSSAWPELTASGVVVIVAANSSFINMFLSRPMWWRDNEILISSSLGWHWRYNSLIYVSHFWDPSGQHQYTENQMFSYFSQGAMWWEVFLHRRLDAGVFGLPLSDLHSFMTWTLHISFHQFFLASLNMPGILSRLKL